MLLSGSLAIGRLTTQQCFATCRNLSLRRVAIVSTLSTSLARHYATNGQSTATADSRPVSRPKAHTGRTTSAGRSRAAPKAAKAGPSASRGSSSKRPGRPRAKRAKAKPKAKSEAKKKAKPKPKPKKKTKKPLTDQQKAAAAITKKRQELKTLKEKALTPPSQLPSTAYTVIHYERIKDTKNDGKVIIAEVARNASAEYKALSTEQREHYNHIANENKAKNARGYRQWIESHPPTVIHEANVARAALRRRSGKSRSWNKLQDDRQVKRVRNYYSYFFRDRYESGDFRGISIAGAAKRIGQEWKALSDSEKQPYADRANNDMVRYEQEVKSVYNRDVERKSRKG